MPETILAIAVVLVCAVLLVRLLLSPARRLRMDIAVRRTAAAVSRSAQRLWRAPGQRREAARQAREAIERARGEGWEGNVYRPKSFRRPKKPH